jgi:hypothetical protein
MKLVLTAIVLILVAVAVAVWAPWKKSAPATPPAAPVVTTTSTPLSRPGHNAKPRPVQTTGAPVTAEQPVAAITPEPAAPVTTAAPSEPAPLSFRDFFHSDASQALAKITLTDEQAKALQAFEANIFPLVKSRLDQTEAALATAKEQWQANHTDQTKDAALNAFEDDRKGRLDIEKLYYEGLKQILTADQFNQIPAPGTVRHMRVRGPL